VRNVPDGVGIEAIRRGSGERTTIRKGQRVATATGEPLELLLWVQGRGDHAEVELGGAADELAGARFGI
jgi:hypothetical protein